MVRTILMLTGFLLISTVSIVQGYHRAFKDQDEMISDLRNLGSNAFHARSRAEAAFLDLFNGINFSRRQNTRQKCQSTDPNAYYVPLNQNSCTNFGRNPRTNSWQECKDLCSASPTCIVWSFDTRCQSNICYLMSSRGQRIPDNDMISGVCDSTQQVSTYWGCTRSGYCWRGAGGNQNANLYGPDFCGSSTTCTSHAGCRSDLPCVGAVRTDASLTYSCLRGRCARSCYLRDDLAGAANMHGWCYTQSENPSIQCTTRADCANAAQSDQCVEPCRSATADPMPQ